MTELEYLERYFDIDMAYDNAGWLIKLSHIGSIGEEPYYEHAGYGNLELTIHRAFEYARQVVWEKNLKQRKGKNKLTTRK